MGPDARTVLVVDDDPAHLYAIGRRLEHAGFLVLTAAGGAQAIELAPGVDAVILDVQLPDMTGFEVCRHLREQCGLNDLPIIQISAAYVETADMVLGLTGGADAYLTRPVDDDVLVANLRALLRLRDNMTHLSRQLDITRRAEERAKTLFMAMLNHDLRNPLDVIAVSGQLLARAPATPELNAGIARRITTAATRMQHLLDDMQDHARTQLGAELTLNLAPQRLGALAAAAIDELLAAQPPGQRQPRIELTVNGQDDGIWDERRLARVLTNLLRNALQHGAEARPIYVAIDGTSRALRTLSVRNEGAPIPIDVMRTLFQPMAPRVTPAPSPANMGLGLFVCKEIVEAHGGTITLSSDASGTECRITLPSGL